MRHRIVSDGTPRVAVAVFEAGDEVVAGLSRLADDLDLTAASITGVGALERATVGWYDLEEQEYRPIPVEEQAELLSMVGDVAVGPDGSAAVHVHAVLGLRDGSTRGGHLLEARVRPTLEAVVTETPADLAKTYRPEFGLALIDLDR